MNTIKQQTDGDCAICVLAMFLGLAYDDVLPLYTPLEIVEGVMSYRTIEVANTLGVGLSIIYDEDFNPAKPALVCVDSLNPPAIGHMIYWDGTQVHDPSNKKTYDNIPVQWRWALQ